MKKLSILAMAAATLLMSSCGALSLNQENTSNAASNAGSAATNALGGLLSAATDGQTLGNLLTSVLGMDKVTKANLVGTWTYLQPGCAFTSENLLAQAGGEAAATAIKNKLASTYQTVGIKSGNTTVTLNEDGTFAAKIAGKSWSGKWTFDEANYKIVMSGLLLNVTCYAKKNSNGIGLLFEASKLLTILQTMAKLSGNSTAQTIGDLSKNYDGLRIGFDMKK